jgi:hypothetical protein
MMAKRNDRFKDTFCDFATQYYVAARLAARAGLVPIHGNLFHHAVEMYLKGALVGTLPVEDMKRKPYSHDLTAIWDRFKTKEADPALARFDPLVQKLQLFESIRYPDKIVNEGLVATVVWQAHHATTVSGSVRIPPKYEFIIEDVDNLMIEVLHRIPRNPRALITMVSDAYARQTLGYQNPQTAKWL